MYWENQVSQPSPMAKWFSRGQFLLNLLLKKRENNFSYRSREPCLKPQRLCREMASCEEVYPRVCKINKDIFIGRLQSMPRILRGDKIRLFTVPSSPVIYYVNFYEPRVAFVCGLCAALRKPRARGGKKGICVLSTRSAKLVTHADYFCHSGLLWNV